MKQSGTQDVAKAKTQISGYRVWKSNYPNVSFNMAAIKKRETTCIYLGYILSCMIQDVSVVSWRNSFPVSGDQRR